MHPGMEQTYFPNSVLESLKLLIALRYDPDVHLLQPRHFLRFLFILSRVYGSVTNNNGVLDWMIGFIDTFFYNLS
jgi:hypothetical protein